MSPSKKPLIKIIEFLVTHPARVVTKRNDIELYIVHQFELRFQVHLFRKMLGDIQAKDTRTSSEKINVLSVACGPALETQDVLKTKAD